MLAIIKRVIVLQHQINWLYICAVLFQNKQCSSYVAHVEGAVSFIEHSCFSWAPATVFPWK